MVGALHVPAVAEGDEEVADGVLFADGLPGDAAPAAALDAVGVQRDALHVPAVAEGDDDVRVRDEVLLSDVLDGGVEDLRAALVAVLFLQVRAVLLDEGVDLLGVLQQVDEVLDELLELVVLLLDAGGLQLREAAQLHVEDGLRLAVGELERRGLQCGLRGLGGRRGADRGDHLVEQVEGLEQPFEDVRALARLVEVEL